MVPLALDVAGLKSPLHDTNLDGPRWAIWGTHPDLRSYYKRNTVGVRHRYVKISKDPGSGGPGPYRAAVAALEIADLSWGYLLQTANPASVKILGTNCAFWGKHPCPALDRMLPSVSRWITHTWHRVVIPTFIGCG